MYAHFVSFLRHFYREIIKNRENFERIPEKKLRCKVPVPSVRCVYDFDLPFLA